ERARREAERPGLSGTFHVADMRRADAVPRGPFDLVIACGHAVPHLLTDEDTLTALRAMRSAPRPGGGGLVTVGDYDAEERAGTKLVPYGVREEGGRRWVVFQVWQFHVEVYDLALYLVEDGGGPECLTRVMRSRYRAVGTGRLLELMGQAGFR